MLELQRIRFAGWALTEGQHRPKAGKKKRPAKRVFFFWFPLRKRCSIEKGVNRLFPAQVDRPSVYSLLHSTEASASPGHAQVKNGHTTPTCPNASASLATRELPGRRFLARVDV